MGLGAITDHAVLKNPPPCRSGSAEYPKTLLIPPDFASSEGRRKSAGVSGARPRVKKIALITAIFRAPPSGVLKVEERLC